MVRIRLRRVGAKKQPSYRVVAADKESPRDGRFLEVLGFYNPRTEPSTIHFTEDRVYHWLSVGAQPSDAVRRLFDQSGLWDRYQRFKDGEDVAKLMEEAAAAEDARDVDPRTRRDDIIGQTNKPAKADEAIEETPVAEVAEVEDADETEEAEDVEETDAEVVEEAEDTETADEVDETPDTEDSEEEELPEAEEEPAEEAEEAETDAEETDAEEADAEEAEAEKE
ncbi:MAG: 30S ribosomal protein S16 [Anaerolineales bacterium]|nr:30S ribosomal protein S16 [Chloroflexota bacterium]MBL6982088.1 30S ribosomal protein S16 [Anaerolineales bacterium]